MADFRRFARHEGPKGKVLPPFDPAALAADLEAAARTRTPLTGLSARLADSDVPGAYAVQRAGVAVAVAAGRRRSGWKLGCTSEPVQKMLNASTPDYGVLFADTARPDGAIIPWADVMQPLVEAEIAFVLGRDIAAAPADPAALLAAIAEVRPAIEIVCSRVAAPPLRFVDTIADNASAGLYVLGAPRAPAGLDLVNCAMELRGNGAVVATGFGHVTLDGPLNALAWLARAVTAAGEILRAGEVVMAGSLGPVARPAPGGRYAATIAGIGAVAMEFGPA